MIRIVAALLIIIGGGNLAFAGPLHDAARDGDLEQIRSLIAGSAELDARGENGETPLILAILEGHADAAELLIEQGADISARNASSFPSIRDSIAASRRSRCSLVTSALQPPDGRSIRRSASSTPTSSSSFRRSRSRTPGSSTAIDATPRTPDPSGSWSGES